jgi:hypothetical protein
MTHVREEGRKGRMKDPLKENRDDKGFCFGKDTSNLPPSSCISCCADSPFPMLNPKTDSIMRDIVMSHEYVEGNDINREERSRKEILSIPKKETSMKKTSFSSHH